MSTANDFIDEPIRRRLPGISAPDSGSSMAMIPEKINAWKTKMGYGGRHSRRAGARRAGARRAGARRTKYRRGSRRSCRR